MLAAPAIPFTRPYLGGNELRYLEESLRSGDLTGDGPFTAAAAERLAELVGGGQTLLTTSCTHALEMSALLLDLQPGDEVLMPSFTFVSTANAFVLRGAVPVFIDCRPDTLNIDERLVEAAITERTRAVVVVHYGGVACDMVAISSIAQRHGLAVIEDNAHGLGGSYRGRPLGSWGAMATQSFHATKNVSCGEGGALVINDEQLTERAEILREKGTNRKAFFRGQVNKYRWVDYGSSYLPADPLAALLLAQLEIFGDIQRRRHAVWKAYAEGLAQWAGAHGFTLPVIPGECEHPAHVFYVVGPDEGDQSGLIEHLSRHGIQATFHYVPLHSAPAGLRFGRVGPAGCDVTAALSARLVRLPLYTAMTEQEWTRVVSAVSSYRT